MMKDLVIKNKYRVDRKIGQGGFGIVYIGTDVQSNQEVAIKLTAIDKDDWHMLETESETCEALSGGAGMPQFLWFGHECEYNVFVHELLGPSLENLLNYCGRRFSLKTVLLIADQAISRIEHIHSKGFLHRDIKPHNLLMGAGRQGNTLYTVDFGLAKEFSAAEYDRRREGSRAFCGTSDFASLNSHRGLEQSRADDLESLGYSLIYLSRGSLPWGGLSDGDDRENREKIKQMKTEMRVETLCAGLPDEFATYLSYARSLEFEVKPDYAYLRRLFRRLFDSKGFKHDNVFDWTEKLFYEINGQASSVPESETLLPCGRKRACETAGVGRRQRTKTAN